MTPLRQRSSTCRRGPRSSPSCVQASGRPGPQGPALRFRRARCPHRAASGRRCSTESNRYLPATDFMPARDGWAQTTAPLIARAIEPSADRTNRLTQVLSISLPPKPSDAVSNMTSLIRSSSALSRSSLWNGVSSPLPPVKVINKFSSSSTRGQRTASLGACPRNSGFWWRRLRESDSACL